MKPTIPNVTVNIDQYSEIINVQFVVAWSKKNPHPHFYFSVPLSVKVWSSKPHQLRRPDFRYNQLLAENGNTRDRDENHTHLLYVGVYSVTYANNPKEIWHFFY